nr:retrovirus-related Pol polyprotein from transposon TNT 1-94 [Tanacetum cinerariifolium]
ERCFEISQEKYDKLERCYQQSVYQEQCLSKQINAIHLSSGKHIMTLNEQISELNKQLSKEKSAVSFLLEEKKRLKSDFRLCEDKLLDKQIQLEKRIKELNNIVLKTGQSIQTIHMLSPKPNSFYHTEQKMALGYQNPFYLKQAQKKQQSLYDGKVLLEKHDLPVVHDSKETLQLAQESHDKMKQMNKEIKPAYYTKINHLLGVFVPQTALVDATLAKHKALELEMEIERLLKAVVSQDIMIIVQNESVVDTSDLQTELERMFRINPYKTSREAKKVPNSVSASARTKPITVSQPPVITKKDVNFDNVNGKNTYGKNKKAKVSVKEIQMKYQPKVTKSKKVIQICLWCVDLGCSKHMTGNLKLLINFIWKFMGTVRFENVHVAAILGFGDLQWGNILITNVYFVKGWGYNLFSVRQFYDSDLEVAFRRNAFFVKNLEGVDLLKRDRSTNLYIINLHEMTSASLISLMARASSTKSWLWLQRLSHLNFDTINDLARINLVTGLPKFKYHKEHLCPSCDQGKSKRASYPPKRVPNSRQRLHLLHMDLCGPMRIASINGNRYVLVIVDDYSRYTWVHFLRSKDEALEVIIKFLKRITVLLKSPVIIIRTDNGTEFKNQVLKEYFDTVGISHQMSSVRTPQQNGVVERRNQTLVEAARTMLIFSRVSLFLWAEAIATACFTQNRSIIHRRFNKIPYELINGKKPDISFLDVFGALCYPRMIMKTFGNLVLKVILVFSLGILLIPVLTNSKPELQSMTSGQISSGLNLTYAPSTITTQQPSEGKLDLLFEAMYDDYIGG